MRVPPPNKTFKAAAFHFDDNLTPAYCKSDINAYNVSAGLYHLACALDALEARLKRIEADLQRQK